MRLLCLCIFLALLAAGLSQSNGSMAAALSLYAQADEQYNKALQLSSLGNFDEAREKEINQSALDGFIRFLQVPSLPGIHFDSLRCIAALKAGELEHYFDNFSQALRYYNVAIKLKERLPAVNDSFLFKPCLFSGLIYYNQNSLDSATTYLKKAEAIQEKAGHPLQERERLYNILGSIHYQYGNYKQAKNYFQKAAETLSTKNSSYRELVVNYKMNTAASLLGLEQYDSARIIYQSLLSSGRFFLNQINNQLGLIQLNLGAPEQAIGYFKKIKYGGYPQVGLYNDIANAYLHLKQLDSVRRYLLLAIEKHKAHTTSATSVDYGRTLKLCGELEEETGNFTAAVRFYQQAIHQFYPAFTDTSSTSNPPVFSGAFSYINLFQTLVAKAETAEALYHRERKDNWATLSLETYKAAFSLIGYVEQTYESDEARLFLSKIKQALHNKPIDLAFERYQQTGNEAYLSLLYTFDQQTKAAVLALNRQLNSVLDTSASPSAKKERLLKAEITRLSIKAAQAADSARGSLNIRIRDHEIELGKIREKLYPKEAVKDNVPSLQTLQAGFLDRKTVLVSYHLSSEKLTTLVVTNNSAACYQQRLPRNFTTLVEKKILALRTPSLNPAEHPDTSLYNLLLTNVPLAGKEQLIIIPDDVLNYLPFESLQNNKGEFLIEQTAVQYQFSTALLTENKTNFSTAQTLSFAPFANRSYTDSFSVLPESAKEIEGAEGKRFFDTAATKENFLAYGPAFPVVHLATHAVANNSADAFSYVAFSPAQTGRDNLLYAREVYNLRLQQTGLIILSACETGAGNLVKGEGVISLSRAFAYAGCPNVITSLWKADDFSTAYLTTQIHSYLQQGFSITNAVRKAKLDYLTDRKINPRLKQPYYWSHLIFIGAYQPEKKISVNWIVAIVLLLFFSFLLYKITSRKTGR